MSVTLTITISDLSFFAFDEKRTQCAVLFPDARHPRQGPDGKPLPTHHPVFIFHDRSVQPLPWFLADEDVLLEPKNPSSSFNIDDPNNDFFVNVPPIRVPLGAGGTRRVHAEVLQPVPIKGIVSARLRELYGGRNQPLIHGTLKTGNVLGNRKPEFIHPAGQNAPIGFPGPTFAQDLVYQLEADEITISGVRFGETAVDHRSFVLEKGSHSALLGNFGVGYPSKARDQDPDYAWFYDLLDTHPNTSDRRIPEFNNGGGATGGGDCVAASGGI